MSANRVRHHFNRSFTSAFTCLLAGGLLTWLFRGILTPLITFLKPATGGSALAAVVLHIGLWLLLSGLLYAVLWNPTLNLAVNRRLSAVLFLAGMGFILVFFLNNILPLINMTSWQFGDLKPPFDYHNLAGVDFRTGIYRRLAVLFSGENIYTHELAEYSFLFVIYPPFTFLFFMPLFLLSESIAYMMMVLLIFASTVLSIILSALSVIEVFAGTGKTNRLVTTLLLLIVGLAVSFYSLSSYGFLFSIERGNYDSIAILLGTAGIYTAVKKPKNIWLQVLLISIAAHLKIYPAALFVVLLALHGKKMILPTLVINSLLFLSLGFNNMLEFFKALLPYMQAPASWVGNHSAHSFTDYLFSIYTLPAGAYLPLLILLTVLPIILWTAGCYTIIKKLPKETWPVFLLMISIPIMCLIPSTSHDYKLIILSPAVFILVTLLVIKIIHYSSSRDYLQLLVVLVLLLLIGRSYTLIPEALPLLANKYPLVMALLVFTLMNILPFRKIKSVLTQAQEDDLRSTDMEPAGVNEG